MFGWLPAEFIIRLAILWGLQRPCAGRLWVARAQMGSIATAYALPGICLREADLRLHNEAALVSVAYCRDVSVVGGLHQ